MMSYTPSQGAMGAAVATPLQQVRFEHGLTLRDIEKAVILETLRRQNFNRTRAARVLGIGIRTLQRKLKQYRAEAGVSAAAEVSDA